MSSSIWRKFKESVPTASMDSIKDKLADAAHKLHIGGEQQAAAEPSADAPNGTSLISLTLDACSRADIDAFHFCSLRR